MIFVENKSFAAWVHVFCIEEFEIFINQDLILQTKRFYVFNWLV